MAFSLLRPLCLFGLHNPSDADSKWFGHDCVTTCTRCGARIGKQRFDKRFKKLKQPRRRTRGSSGSTAD